MIRTRGMAFGCLVALLGLDRAGADSNAFQADSVALKATVTLNGKAYSFSGKGECQHATEASIYQVPATMWRASFQAGGGALEHVNLSLWQPKAGGAIQVNLQIVAGGTTYEIATVKGTTQRGTGTARVERAEQSGTLLVTGVTAAGHPIQLSIACSRFTAPEENG